MKRLVLAFAALALAACSPPASAPEDASAGSTGVGNIEAPAFTLESEALLGRWGFDRTCGLFDLIFYEDDRADYYDYSEQTAISYTGSWETADNNRVVLTLRRLDAEGSPTGDPLAYNLDVTSTVTDDLIGRFGPAGGVTQEISAKRCNDVEDRE